tara:strand:- start:331 stop:444 length:114 start_codon:yes stop_codon:yes gene_type:complete
MKQLPSHVGLFHKLKNRKDRTELLIEKSSGKKKKKKK